MRRKALHSLTRWKNRAKRAPLVIRGARQVGKTYLVEYFGKNYFKNCVTINFEQQRQYHACFKDLNPKHIITTLQILSQQKIIPGETLLFLDEIQSCKEALMSLRYFKEQMPELHVIAAGSLLELVLTDKEFRMPVGRVEFLYLKPLSFEEFLMAKNYPSLIEYVKEIKLTTKIHLAIEQQLEQLLREYFLVGGMPEVADAYIHRQDLHECSFLHHFLLTAYRDDFAHYANKTKHQYLQSIFEKAPGMIGQRFRYSRVDPHMQSRDLKQALDFLVSAGVIYKVHATNAAGLPLIAGADEKAFKLLFLDLGLIQSTHEIKYDVLMKKDLMLLNQGMLTEQFVGQELMAYHEDVHSSRLFYWSREKKGSMAEVDYVIQSSGQIIPIEVKSGKTGSLRSMHVFLQEKKLPFGVRISMLPLSFEKNILSVPLYLISELSRLIEELISHQ